MRPIHEKLREALKKKGLKIADVSRQMPEVSPATVGHWFTGERKPLVDNLKKLAGVLGVAVSRLIEDDPDYAQTPKEREILRALRKMGDSQQEAFLAMAVSVSGPPDE